MKQTQKLNSEYKNIKPAINMGNYMSMGRGLCCIGWNQKTSSWVIYTTTGGAPTGVKPEFFCVGSGILPVPLSSEAAQIFNELFPIDINNPWHEVAEGGE